MTYGLIDRKSHKFYTYMRTVFQAIENEQKQYNWLITDWNVPLKTKKLNNSLIKNIVGYPEKN